MARNRHL